MWWPKIKAFEQDTLAVGVAPNRRDGLLTIHVGPCWVAIDGHEAVSLAKRLMRSTGKDVLTLNDYD